MNLDKIFQQLRSIEKTRTIESSLIYGMSELSEEILKISGHSIKPETSDGVIGESVDVILCMLDIIQLHSVDITGDEVEVIIQNKITKWANKKYDL